MPANTGRISKLFNTHLENRIKNRIFKRKADSDVTAQQARQRIEALEARVAELSDALEKIASYEKRITSGVRRKHENLRAFCDLLMYQAKNAGGISSGESSNERNILVVTGADSSHYRQLLRLLFSLEIHEPLATILAYDLGLHEKELQSLQKLFPSVHIRRFDFDRYPEHFNIKINAGEYAWKPVIVYEASQLASDYLIWMDAGNLVVKPLHDIRAILDKHGLYSPKSAGRIKKWTHAGMIKALGLPAELLHEPNRNGALVSLDSQNPMAIELLERWRLCALDRDCIAPPGSSRSNHRQDQAALSVLISLSTFSDSPLELSESVRIHQDL